GGLRRLSWGHGSARGREATAAASANFRSLGQRTQPAGAGSTEVLQVRDAGGSALGVIHVTTENRNEGVRVHQRPDKGLVFRGAELSVALRALTELRMRVRLLVLLLGIVVVAACGTDPTIPPSALNVPFSLQTVNGAAIPATVFDSAVPPV